jgi:hypothetical protein
VIRPHTHIRGSLVPETVIRYDIKSKVAAIPLQDWAGPDGSRRLRLPDFKTIGT